MVTGVLCVFVAPFVAASSDLFVCSNLHIFQHPGLAVPNRFPPSSHPCTSRSRFTAVECSLRPFHPRRCIFSLDGSWYPPHCRGCSSHRHFRNRSRTHSLAGRPPRSLFPPGICGVFHFAGIRRPRVPCHRETHATFCCGAANVLVIQTHLSEYSYSVHLRNQPPSRPSSPLLIPTNSSTDLTTERTPLIDRKRYAASTISLSSSATQKHAIPSRTPLLLSISYASTSGILSGMCLVFAKSGVELLLVSINGNNQFWQWQAWMLIFGLVAFALLQLWYLHKALKLADPTIVCPREFCLPSHPFSTNAFHL